MSVSACDDELCRPSLNVSACVTGRPTEAGHIVYQELYCV